MPTVTFTGIDVVRKATIVKSRGASPSKATLVCQIQSTAPPLTGTLTLTDDSGNETWQDATILHAVRRHVTNTTGHFATVVIGDRRAKWKHKRLSGIYNTRLGDGSVSTTNKKSVKELIDLIFQQLGETVDSAAAPGDLYPRIKWKNTRCDKAIDRLLYQVGCEITLDYQSNTAKVHKRGQGAQLPSAGTEIEPPLSLTAGAPPSKLKIVGAPVLVQSKFLMEAVALDSDGSWKKVDDVSYKPSGGWGSEWPMGFEGITVEKDRVLAQQTVWRCFAIKEFAEGGLSIPELPSVTISSPTQLLPLKERLLETDADHNGVSRQNVPYLDGTWQYGPPAGTKYNGAWRIIDREQGIIQLETPAFQISSQTIVAPDLYLVVAHHVRDKDTDGLIYYDRERSLGSGDDTVTEEVPELARSIIRVYTGTVIGSITDNKQALDTETDKYLDALERRVSTDTPASMRYRGFIFPPLDGAIAQVKHVFGAEAYTDVSRNYEDDIFTPPVKREEYTEEEHTEPHVFPPCGNAHQPAIHRLWARTGGTLSPLSSATFRIWIEDSGGSMVDTGIDVTGYDNLLESGGSLTAKWRVELVWHFDRYYVANAACAVDTSATVWGT